jgi:two-component system sensor histidine kinase CpxA
MNELIGQLLALSRAERDERAARAERVDVVALVRDVAGDAQYEAGRQGKSVVLRADLEAHVAGDAELLRSAIENVVRNAVRYTPDSTAAEIVVARDGDTVTIAVGDHGPGVPDAELERIFDPFHRVGSARTRESGGTGLGLAIARRAVVVHGGTIAARNLPSGGLEVTVRLPARR